MVRSLEEIQADRKKLAQEEKESLKAHKKDAIAEVKKLILQNNLTKVILDAKQWSSLLVNDKTICLKK